MRNSAQDDIDAGASGSRQRISQGLLSACEHIFEQVIRDEGQRVLGWRELPVEDPATTAALLLSMPAGAGAANVTLQNGGIPYLLSQLPHWMQDVMLALKITRVGNSTGVVLPKEALSKLRVAQGEGEPAVASASTNTLTVTKAMPTAAVRRRSDRAYGLPGRCIMQPSHLRYRGWRSLPP